MDTKTIPHDVRLEQWRRYLRTVASIASEAAGSPDSALVRTAVNMFALQWANLKEAILRESSEHVDWNVAWRELLTAEMPYGAELRRELVKRWSGLINEWGGSGSDVGEDPS